MKRVFVALVLGVLSTSCEQILHLGGSGPKKATRELQGLNGPVRSVSVAVAVPVNKDGTWEPGEQKSVSMDAYDKKGNRTEYVRSTAEGAISSKIVFTYNAQGNETEASQYNASGVPESRTTSTYDAKGYRTESHSYADDGTLTRRIAFTYDAQGNETAAYSYTPEGAPESSTVSIYDVKGNLEETAWYYANGIQGGQVVYKRDTKGLLLSSVALDYALDGTLQSRTDATYDARGNPTEVVWYGDNSRFKTRETSTYRYDIFGNWTQQTTTKWVSRESGSSFEPPVVIYRMITYYGRGTE
jgi:hypothetical protein